MTTRLFIHGSWRLSGMKIKLSSVFLKVAVRHGILDIKFAPQGASVKGAEGLHFLPQP